MPIVEPFDKYSSKYEDWFDRNKFVYQSELLALETKLPKGKKGIEIGVGSGRFAAPLNVRIGVEPSQIMQKLAYTRNILTIGGTAEKLPLKDEKFDFALMVTTICFVDDISVAFSEAYRILRPGGHLVIGFVDRDSLIGREYLKHKQENVFYRYATFYSVDDVILYLKKVGFKNFDFVQTVFHNLKEVNNLEPIEEGYGKGSFVVVDASK